MSSEIEFILNCLLILIGSSWIVYAVILRCL